PAFVGAMQTLYLGAAAGSRKIYVNVDRLKPGAKSVKYHSHSLQEEFFLILAGRGTVRLEGENRPVREGDFFAKPAGEGVAHQFINTGGGTLEILDCGLVKADDVVLYPDEGTLLFKRERKAFNLGGAMEGWSSDPNPPAGGAGE
ncbi:MAG: mannose-6-phosphate isomerase, partial [Candidatus Coatesbacteria bacterium RBG_13_66_14]